MVESALCVSLCTAPPPPPAPKVAPPPPPPAPKAAGCVVINTYIYIYMYTYINTCVLRLCHDPTQKQKQKQKDTLKQRKSTRHLHGIFIYVYHHTTHTLFFIFPLHGTPRTITFPVYMNTRTHIFCRIQWGRYNIIFCCRSGPNCVHICLCFAFNAAPPPPPAPKAAPPPPPPAPKAAGCVVINIHIYIYTHTRVCCVCVLTRHMSSFSHLTLHITPRTITFPLYMNTRTDIFCRIQWSVQQYFLLQIWP